MNRIPCTAALLVLASLADAPRAGGAEPKFSLELKADTPKVKLGERIKLTATLKSNYARTISAPELKVGTPTNLVLYVKRDGRTCQIARLFGKFDGKAFKGEPTGTAKELKRGESLTGALEVLAIRTGALQFSATYLGLDRAASPEPLDSRPVAVTVDPGPGGETKVGAKIKTSKGTMTAELYPDKAFNTVLNFLTLGQEGFYDGRVFHRIVKDFMVQTGCPKGNGTGGPGYYIPAEFNDLKHEKGLLSMARETEPNTAGSQFFIVHGKNEDLDGRYAGFGRVVQGMEVLEALAAVPVQRSAGGGEISEPVEKPKLQGVEMVLLK